MSRPVLSVLVWSQTALWILTNYKITHKNSRDCVTMECNSFIENTFWFSNQFWPRYEPKIILLSEAPFQQRSYDECWRRVEDKQLKSFVVGIINTMVVIHCKQWGSFLQSHAQTFWWWSPSPSPSDYLL